MDIKRKDASQFINFTAFLVARHGAGELTAERVVHAVSDLLAGLDVDLPTPCDGEAHKPEFGGNIDHCSLCMSSGHWGWSHPKDAQAKVK